MLRVPVLLPPLGDVDLRTAVALAVWGYMVVAVLQEVETTFLVHVYSTEATIITILAASQAVAIVLFYMQLKEEPGSMKLFVLVPVMFLSALLIALLASLG